MLRAEPPLFSSSYCHLQDLWGCVQWHSEYEAFAENLRLFFGPLFLAWTLRASGIKVAILKFNEAWFF